MELGVPKPDKLTAESAENSYATHDGKNKRLIADLQSNIYQNTILYTQISYLASQPWYPDPTQFHNSILWLYQRLNTEEAKSSSTYQPRYQNFHRINFIWKHSSSSSSYTRWSDRFSATSCLFSVKLVLLCSCEASEPEIVFVDIQKHREFPFGHLHEKDILDMDSQLTCRRAKSTASGCFL